MILNVLFSFYVVIYVSVESIKLTKYEKKGDRLVLKPIELIDLILEDHPQKEIKVPLINQLRIDRATTSVWVTNKNNGDASSRKIWSRWSKWGECSTICGVGAKVRRRLCVAGRCAHGELEEQRRPCLLPPCTTTHENGYHDAD